MQAPIFLKITNWLQILTWKLVTEVLVSSLANSRRHGHLFGSAQATPLCSARQRAAIAGCR